MRSQGRSVGSAVGLWAATAALLTLAVVVGRQALAAAEPSTLAFPLAFAGGAVLASLADTLMPEAFERGRPLNAFATAPGSSSPSPSRRCSSRQHPTHGASSVYNASVDPTQ
jgi:zinc transporter, ZIP family